MKRKLEQWKNCNPKTMADDMSNAAIFYAFQDAQADILELNAENQRLRDILRQIAYPKRGTREDAMSLIGFAEMIQQTYTLEQLQGSNGFTQEDELDAPEPSERDQLRTHREMLMRIYENAQGYGDSIHAVTRWEVDTLDYQALEDFLFPKGELRDDT